jgi:hypothetical protein
MSLVNDALRRAQDAQKKVQPAATGLALRPAEPAPAQKRGIGPWIAAITAFAAIMALSFLWRGWKETYPVHATAQPKPAAPAVAIAETKAPVQQMAAPVPGPAAVVAAEKPAPTPALSAPVPQLKLQAIFFAPGHSSAIISGKTVHAGDNFKGFRVAAITQTSATLASATQTNVITLEPE